MPRRDDLRRVEQALTRISRISMGREAARIRAARSGVHLSRPSIAILSTLRLSGPVRMNELSALTDLEPPLISREVRDLLAAGMVRRRSDPTDGRAGIVELTTKGRRASEAYRAATDEIIAESFSKWSAAELRQLAEQLERVVADFSRPPAVRT
ncbi:MAG TPA: MarR family winged helix-turn-helix transcriptional regulator [Acidimicrobiales bacterium]|nr:MarR family winged helix-turn-helix transcriptional regulator [Acidimicrobiales bacterium]